MRRYVIIIFALFASAAVFTPTAYSAETVQVWDRQELSFRSEQEYDNPIYDVENFSATFTSPTDREVVIHGFWDGGTDWKIRFMPDEPGTWSYTTTCSDEDNSGLHGQSGSFRVVGNAKDEDIFRRGAIERPDGLYYLTYSDGTPFFFTACTAWNGALHSTEEDWDTYLSDRVEKGYNTIQFVTTPWRGAEANRLGQVAFTGAGKIEINVDFYKYLDKKVDRINEFGLVAAPVLLWALPFGQGMELSPGYYLPEREAILLARYMVARYGAHHVVWILGGDGRYVETFEQRWKNIGRGVFGDPHPGVVAQHPHGRSWIGEVYEDEEWLDIYGYQSSHSAAERTVNWLNRGPMAETWNEIPAKPIINMEPNYEEIGFRISPEDVRNASYWSLFNAPTAGITYGHNGIWPWIESRDETPLNHRHDTGITPWNEAIDAPGSRQIGYLTNFMQQYTWWKLKPANHLLMSQPGDEKYDHFISVAATPESDLIMVYIPTQSRIGLRNPFDFNYSGQWFNPETNEKSRAKISVDGNMLTAESPREGDMVLVLQKK
jgi:hypothetical protein